MNTKNSFETSLSALEKIVRKLEEGDLTLEESLRLFEDGVRLSRECQERLGQAERRIEILLNDENGNPVLQTIEKNEARDDSASEPKVKRRIVFDDAGDEKDESPF
ncbi:MAG: exodeoxyribonuclease VII small subunit [Pyrinomonadaceae bacterium]